MMSEVERAGPSDWSDQGMSNWYSLPDSELMVDTWGEKNSASCQYSSVASNLPSAMPEVASLYLIALDGFLPRVYFAVFQPLETFKHAVTIGW